MNTADYEMPDVLLEIPEVRACFQLAGMAAEFFTEKLQELSKEMHPDTASEEGLSRFEKMVGITPRETDTTEERRFRVTVARKVIDVLNARNLIDLIEDLTRGDCRVIIDKAAQTVTVKVGLTSKKMFTLVEKTVRDYIPVDMRAEVLQMYNRYVDYNGKTYAELSDKTFKQLKEEVIENE